MGGAAIRRTFSIDGLFLLGEKKCDRLRFRTLYRVEEMFWTDQKRDDPDISLKRGLR